MREAGNYGLQDRGHVGSTKVGWFVCPMLESLEKWVGNWGAKMGGCPRFWLQRGPLVSWQDRKEVP